MGAKTKTVGGTPTTPLAKDFTSFLGNSLNQTGDFQNTINSLLSGTGQTQYNDYLNSLQNNVGNVPNISAQQVNPGQATTSSISGSNIDPSLINSYAIQPGQMAASQVNAQGVNTALANSAGPVAAQQVNPNASNIDFSSLINQQYGVNQPNLANILQSANLQNQPQIDFSALANLTGSNANLGAAPGNFAAPAADLNNPVVKAIADYANQNLNQNVNAIRERFTSGGGAGMGTPAAYAEAQTRALGTTDLANSLAQFAQQQQNVQLQNNALNSSNALTARGQDLQNYLGQQGINLSALQSMQGNQLNQRGQDLTAQLQSAGIDAQTAQALASGLLQQGSQTLQGQQLGGQQQQTLAQLFGQQGQFNAGQFNQGQLANQGIDLQALLANQATQQQTNLANQGALNQGGQFNASQNLQGQLANQSNDQFAQSTNLQAQLQALLANQQNAFNTQSANQQATQNAALANQQNALQTGQLNQSNNQAIQLANLQAMLQGQLSNQGTNLQAQQYNAGNQLQGQANQLNLAQLFGNSAGLTQQGQINALQQMFNSLNQANAIGTPQAQTIQKPSGFQNFVSGVTGLTGAIAPIAGLFNTGTPAVNTGASVLQNGGFYSPQGPQIYNTPGAR